ncbi:uncharacterized protein PSFLO_03268 [Pseudozyma flocculosa]|uniref:Uncharacterized protein n=1 Tax=Pseudozyma flocculosa TaxID=84751 RepID=A0A5C3F0J1_9BASI|nr:uncharacterized protein PSFLO_03268 [Pseudozyma flocculosa]
MTQHPLLRHAMPCHAGPSLLMFFLAGSLLACLDYSGDLKLHRFGVVPVGTVLPGAILGGPAMLAAAPVAVRNGRTKGHGPAPPTFAVPYLAAGGRCFVGFLPSCRCHLPVASPAVSSSASASTTFTTATTATTTTAARLRSCTPLFRHPRHLGRHRAPRIPKPIPSLHRPSSGLFLDPHLLAVGPISRIPSSAACSSPIAPNGHRPTANLQPQPTPSPPSRPARFSFVGAPRPIDRHPRSSALPLASAALASYLPLAHNRALGLWSHSQPDMVAQRS